MFKRTKEKEQRKLIADEIEAIRENDEFGAHLIHDLKIDPDRILIDENRALHLRVDLQKLRWFLHFLADMPEITVSEAQMKEIKVTIIYKAMSQLLDVSLIPKEEEQSWTELLQHFKGDDVLH